MSSSYLHGTNLTEQQRLAKLNELINARCMAAMDIQPGARILDMGSGLGQFTMALAARTGPSGYCLGIDRSGEQLAMAKRALSDSGLRHLEFRSGNVEGVCLQDSEIGTFDVAHTHFVLEHVRQPYRVVQQMALAVKSGGRVYLLDDDHDTLRLFPEPEGFTRLWGAYMESYRCLGNDPFIGRKLVALLSDAGLTSFRNDSVFFGDCAGTQTFEPYARNLCGILETARLVILDNALMTEEDFRTSMKHLQAWSERPDAALWYVISVASAQKP